MGMADGEDVPSRQPRELDHRWSLHEHLPPSQPQLPGKGKAWASLPAPSPREPETSFRPRGRCKLEASGAKSGHLECFGECPYTRLWIYPRHRQLHSFSGLETVMPYLLRQAPLQTWRPVSREMSDSASSIRSPEVAEPGAWHPASLSSHMGLGISEASGQQRQSPLTWDRA